MIIIVFLLGALCYRIRGGLLDDLIGREIPNNYIRAVWALYIAALFLIKTGAWYMAPLVCITAFLGVASGYYGAQFGLIHKENRNLKNYAVLTVRGAMIMLPTALLLMWFSPSIFYAVLAGATFVVCYLAGNVLAKLMPFQAPSQWGEALLGGTIAAVFWKVIPT